MVQRQDKIKRKNHGLKFSKDDVERNYVTFGIISSPRYVPKVFKTHESQYHPLLFISKSNWSERVNKQAQEKVIKKRNKTWRGKQKQTFQWDLRLIIHYKSQDAASDEQRFSYFLELKCKENLNWILFHRKIQEAPCARNVSINRKCSLKQTEL